MILWFIGGMMTQTAIKNERQSILLRLFSNNLKAVKLTTIKGNQSELWWISLGTQIHPIFLKESPVLFPRFLFIPIPFNNIVINQLSTPASVSSRLQLRWTQKRSRMTLLGGDKSYCKSSAFVFISTPSNCIIVRVLYCFRLCAYSTFYIHSPNSHSE